MANLNTVARLLMTIAGIIMYVLGLIGNILNICVFTKWSRPRTTAGNEHHNANQTNNSPLYLLASSIANLMVIIYPLLTRIIYDGFNHLISPNQVILLCQIRYFVLHTFDLMSLTCFCMATFDRYLITSRNVHLRHMSTTRQLTKKIILLIFILISFHSIPVAIYYQVSNAGQCFISSSSYQYYYLYILLLLFHGILPIIFLSIFGSLTYKNLKTLQAQTHAHVTHDKQLSRMLFLMSFAIIISSIPYCMEQIYEVMFTGSNSQQSSLVYLLHIISLILFYTNPVSNFYIYFISTPNFRHELKKLFHYNKHTHHFVHNQIHTTIT
ncbi:unnamed protein product [Adineta steineri]|uniref:G-protein coupled receptors family 1 profile domain-containing protein n=1 Tax=Adineta steineri TaxID=433720 RepID=A0A814F0A6_9BILA|nr:unnamed protein product [Adineta steineri]